MLDNRYLISSSPDFLNFEFTSIGPKGAIKKIVRYQEINFTGIYNLGFGDNESISGYINDLTISNNNDSQKVLATVARTLYLFIDNYPDATVIASGSTEARTRLYRMGITSNLASIEKDFYVMGLTDLYWEPFRKNVIYYAFSVQRKC